jgi:hypothetical protein
LAPSPQPQRALELPYEWAETKGSVRVEITVNDDPVGLGCAEFARGFPLCRARVEPPARGYADALGWVQLVDHTDEEGGFQIDLFQPLGEVTHPFGFFGFAPTFFDAPHSDLENWDFLAHAFLCGIGGTLFDTERDVLAVLGFSWGFTKRGSQFEYYEPVALANGDWDSHLEYLERRFPAWPFAAGFHRHPLQA